MMGNAMYRKQVTNKEYQSWTGYPDSPYLYSVFPYQTILDTYGLINLIVSVRPFYRDGSLVVDGDVFEGVYYDDVTHAWGTAIDHYSARNANSIIESNHDIYTDATLTSVDFSKTTTPEQDGGSTTSLIRIRNLHHKTSVSYPTQGWTDHVNSPIETIEYPYKGIVMTSDPFERPSYNLICSKTPIHTQYGPISSYVMLSGDGSQVLTYSVFFNQSKDVPAYVTDWLNGTLKDYQAINGYGSNGIVCKEANHDGLGNNYWDYVFVKTTTTEQDTGTQTSVSSVVRDKAAFWKDGVTLHRINI